MAPTFSVEPNKTYRVRGSTGTYELKPIQKNGKYVGHSCSCPSWKFQKEKIEKRLRKHIMALNNGTADICEPCAVYGDSATQVVATPTTCVSKKRKTDSIELDLTTLDDNTLKWVLMLKKVTPCDSWDKQELISRIVEADSKSSDKRIIPEDAPLVKKPASTRFNVASANKYDSTKHNPKGMLVMEKYDGYWARWVPSLQSLFTKSGGLIHVPIWFIADMPQIEVTGELCGKGRGTFQKFSGLFRSNTPHDPLWKEARYVIFDVVAEDLKHLQWTKRMTRLPDLSRSDHISVVNAQLCTGKSHLQQLFDNVIKMGGEGLMLREDAHYRDGRTDALLKHKKHDSLEARVIQLPLNGTGGNLGKCGSAVLCMKDGTTFKCKVPNPDNPPALNTVWEIKFMELTQGGKPRHPNFLRPRPDVTWN